MGKINKHFQFSEKDQERLELLQKKLGLENESETMRMLLVLLENSKLKLQVIG